MERSAQERMAKIATYPVRFNLPQDNGSIFVGRHEILETIGMRFKEDSKQLCLSACHGMGGVGKTQIAIRYLYAAGQYQNKLWFNAEKIESLRDQYIDLAVDLKLIDREALKSIPVDDVIRQVKQFLEKLPTPFLII